jgi:hypothetical protein
VQLCTLSCWIQHPAAIHVCYNSPHLTTTPDNGHPIWASLSASCLYGRSLSAFDMGAAPDVLVSTHTSVLPTGRGQPGGNISWGCLPSCTAADAILCLPRLSCPDESMLRSSRNCRLPVKATSTGAPHVPHLQPTSMTGQHSTGRESMLGSSRYCRLSVKPTRLGQPQAPQVHLQA